MAGFGGGAVLSSAVSYWESGRLGGVVCRMCGWDRDTCWRGWAESHV